MFYVVDPLGENVDVSVVRSSTLDACYPHHGRGDRQSGGPDRRFRNNARLPVCRYELLSFASETGISEILQFSRVGPAAEFDT